MGMLFHVDFNHFTDNNIFHTTYSHSQLPAQKTPPWSYYYYLWYPLDIIISTKCAGNISLQNQKNIISHFCIKQKVPASFLLIFLSFRYSHNKLNFPSAWNRVLPSASPQTSWFFPDVFIWGLVSNESPCCKHTHTHATHTTTCENLFCISSKILCLQLQKIPWWQNNNNTVFKRSQTSLERKAEHHDTSGTDVWYLLKVKTQGNNLDLEEKMWRCHCKRHTDVNTSRGIIRLEGIFIRDNIVRCSHETSWPVLERWVFIMMTRCSGLQDLHPSEEKAFHWSTHRQCKWNTYDIFNIFLLIYDF